MTDIARILGNQSQDIDYMKTQLGNQTGTGSGISDFMFREETITISIGSANISSRGLGSSFIVAHPSLGWAGYSAASQAAGSQPYAGDSRDDSWTFQQSGVSMVWTDVGTEVVRNWLGNQAPGVPSHIGIGSDSTTAAVTDTSLGSEFTGQNRYAFESTASGTGYVEFESIIPATEPSEQPTYIREMGLFDNATVETASLFNHNTFVGFNKTENAELQAVIRLNISGA